jgi:hypothetical protein
MQVWKSGPAPCFHHFVVGGSLSWRGLVTQIVYSSNLAHRVVSEAIDLAARSAVQWRTMQYFAVSLLAP